jgi:hypothetical protein
MHAIRWHKMVRLFIHFVQAGVGYGTPPAAFAAPIPGLASNFSLKYVTYNIIGGRGGEQAAHAAHAATSI